MNVTIRCIYQEDWIKWIEIEIIDKLPVALDDVGTLNS